MLDRTVVKWNASLVIGLLGVLAVSLSAGNSIMDMINTEKVERLLAERRENNTRDAENERKFLLQNAVDPDDHHYNEEEVGNGEDDFFDAEVPPETSKMLTDFSAMSMHLLQKNRHRSGVPHYGGKFPQFPKQNFTGIPDVPSILADLTSSRSDRLLKPDKGSLLVTKKEYLKKDWCKTEPIIQKIREEGCMSRTIVNRFCYGQCNSFYIPKNSPRRKRNRKKNAIEDDSDEPQTFKSCSFCKPKRSSWVFVTLRCPTSALQYRKKRVQRIKQCKCIAENINS